MRFSSLFLASSAASLAAAHSDARSYQHVPRLVGRPGGIRRPLDSREYSTVRQVEAKNQKAPLKDLFGVPSSTKMVRRGASEDAAPSGLDTSGVPRVQLGSIAYGPTKIYECINTGDFALSFDDGPYYYTSDLLNKLAAGGIKATFFVTGDNYGRGYINNATYEWPDIIRRMIADGHQVASHSWTHPELSSLDEATRRREMLFTETALHDILGFMPTYMRPPFADCDDACTATMADLGYHIVLWDLDTLGYAFNGEAEISSSISIFDENVLNSDNSNKSWLMLEHDPIYWSVYKLIPYVIEQINTNGWNPVTVGECLGDAPQNWYRDMDGKGVNPYDDYAIPTTTSISSVSPTSTQSTESLPVDPNGSCGAAAGYRCEEGQCCSQYGWCGNDDEFCAIGSGCQELYGSCDSVSTTTSKASSISTNTATATTAITTTATTTSSSTSSAETTLPTKESGECGNGYGCSPGECCSQYGWCGIDTDHCGTGCQPEFGTCDSSISPSSTTTSSPTTMIISVSSSVTPTSTALSISPDNSCGAGKYVCPEGSCCSQYGWCGTDDTYCGAGCQPGFGDCGLDGLQESPDNSCGENTGYRCPSGQCCSQYGWCGDTDLYCGVGCQGGFGTCS